MDDRPKFSPRKPTGAGGRRPIQGPHIGSIELTPTRVLLTVAVAGSLAFIGYAFLVRDTLQIPLLAVGSAVLGLVFAVLAATGALATYEAGAKGRPARAMVMAILGGLAAMIALGCFAGAILGALLYRPG